MSCPDRLYEYLDGGLFGQHFRAYDTLDPARQPSAADSFSSDIDIELGHISTPEAQTVFHPQSIFKQNLVSPTSSTFSVDPRELHLSFDVSKTSQSQLESALHLSQTLTPVKYVYTSDDLYSSSDSDDEIGHNPLYEASNESVKAVYDSPSVGFLSHAAPLKSSFEEDTLTRRPLISAGQELSIVESVKSNPRQARKKLIEVDSRQENEDKQDIKKLLRPKRKVSRPTQKRRTPITPPPSPRKKSSRDYTTSPSAEPESVPPSPSASISSGAESAYDMQIDSSSFDGESASPVPSKGVRLAKKRSGPKRSPKRKRSSSGRNPVARRSQNKASQCKYRNKRNGVYDLNQQTVIKVLNIIGIHLGRHPDLKNLHALAVDYLIKLQDISATEHKKVRDQLEW